MLDAVAATKLHVTKESATESKLLIRSGSEVNGHERKIFGDGIGSFT